MDSKAFLTWLMCAQAGDCRLALAEESAAEVTRLLQGLRAALSSARILLLAPLPKGEYWPNRCTPAFRAFSQALQVLEALPALSLCSSQHLLSWPEASGKGDVLRHCSVAYELSARSCRVLMRTCSAAPAPFS